MRLFSSKKEREPEPEPVPFVAAILVAAGNSTRMGTALSKQFLELDGIPVLAHTLHAFEIADSVREVVISARESDMGEMYSLIRTFGFTKISQIVTGGQTRQASVSAAIAQASAQAEYFAIHDGARPLVTAEMIEKTITAARQYGAAAIGTPVKDTIKLVDAQGFITQTPDRSRLWAVQTPQVFERALYLEAMREAGRDALMLTDDCQLVERMGKQVYMVAGDASNLKITTPEDLYAAQGILKQRAEQE